MACSHGTPAGGVCVACELAPNLTELQSQWSGIRLELRVRRSDGPRHGAVFTIHYPGSQRVDALLVYCGPGVGGRTDHYARPFFGDAAETALDQASTALDACFGRLVRGRAAT